MFQRKLSEQNIEQYFDSYDRDNYLNEAQDLIVRELAPNVERDELIRTYLGAITKNTSVTPIVSTGFHPNGTYVSLPSDFFITLSEEIKDSSGNRIKIKPQKFDYYTSNIANPFKKPYEDLAWRLDGGLDALGNKRHEIISTVGFTTYYISYLTEPKEMSLSSETDCELHSGLHKAIVERAVTLALTDIERGRIKRGEKETVKTNSNN